LLLGAVPYTKYTEKKKNYARGALLKQKRSNYERTKYNRWPY